MPGRRASKKGKKKKRAFLRAVDDFVTSDAVAKFEVLSRICQEAKETEQTPSGRVPLLLQVVLDPQEQLHLDKVDMVVFPLGVTMQH